MIINHNLMANNAIRNMNINQANASKSMSKLSSGLRINSASDDAAGLAISEKMKGQIRGLDQASSNAQDGISMVQTAEGALNETTSILQRMKELATQGANGTNTSTDTDAIQKEFNQLTSEINRIGNTTEFNTQKLLQGSNDKSSIGATASAVTAGTAATNTQAVWDTGTFSALSDGKGGTLSFNGFTLTIAGADTNTTGLQAGTTATAGTLNINTTAVTGDFSSGLQSAAIAAALTTASQTSGSKLAGFTFAVNAGGDGLKITGPNTATSGSNNDLRIYAGGADVAIVNDNSTAGLSSLTVAGVDGTLATKATSSLTFNQVPTEGSTVSVAGKNVAFYDSSKTTYSSATDAATKLGTTAAYVVDINGKGTSDIASAVAALDFKNSGNGVIASATGNKVTFTAETAGVAGDAAITTADAYAGSKSELISGNAANTDLHLASFGMTVTVGSKVFNVDTSTSGLAKDFSGVGNHLDTFGSNGQTAVIDALKNATAADGTKLSDLVDVSFANNGTTTQNLTLAAKNVGTDNVSLTVTGTGAASAEAALGLTAAVTTATTVGTAAVTNGGKDFTQTFQVGANQGQSFNIAIKDMRAQSLDISGTAAGAAHDTVTDAKYVAVKDVTNGTDSTNTEYALDLSTPKAASAAIKVLDNAINAVSSERANLGAYQNRLEHTIANLGTSSENLTSAQSRIADVDMAKEMSTFSKNNILSQAAQAMLAQANQQPQQVLQLLR